MVKPLLKKTLRDTWGFKAQVSAIAMILGFGLAIFFTSWNIYKSLLITQSDFNINYQFGDIFADLYPASAQYCLELREHPIFSSVNCATRSTIYARIDGQKSSVRGYLQTIPDNLPHSSSQIFSFTRRPDLSDQRSGLIVHKGFADANNLKVGDKITLSLQGNSRSFKITAIGVSPEFVYALSPDTMMPDNKNYGIFWLPESLYHTSFGGNNTFNYLSARLGDLRQLDSAKKLIERRLTSYRPFVYPREKQLSHMFVSDEIAQQRITALFMPSIFLIIATFMVQMLLARIVSLQRSQIATLKACGYRDLALFKHYFLMISIIVFLGSILGICFSWPLAAWMIQLYREYFLFPHLNLHIDLSHLVRAFAVVFLVVTFSCYYSFKNIVTLNPADSMRPPTPPDYHTSFISRLLSGWKIQPQTKMILRGITTKPLRWFMSIASISTSLAIIVLALFWGDMVDYMMKMQFTVIQKEDMAIALRNPVPENSIDTLKVRLGIKHLETYRNIPVKLLLGSNEKLLSLSAYPEHPKLRKIITQTGANLSVPMAGVGVSKNFRDTYGKEVGDFLSLEIMEPPKRVIRVPIVYFFDSYLGEAIVTSKSYIERVLGESRQTNEVLFRLPLFSEDKTEMMLKGLPDVSFVFNKVRTYEVFKKLVIEGALNFTYVLTFLAMLMSVGIAYNFARIGFSERSWELASLSVLGISRVAVFSMFAKEILFQFTLSWLPGIFLGKILAGLSLQMMSTEVFFFPLIIYPRSYMIATGVTIVSVALSIFAMYRVFRKLSLTDALKVRE